jgi:hypothetical protein
LMISEVFMLLLRYPCCYMKIRLNPSLGLFFYRLFT